MHIHNSGAAPSELCFLFLPFLVILFPFFPCHIINHDETDLDTRGTTSISRALHLLKMDIFQNHLHNVQCATMSRLATPSRDLETDASPHEFAVSRTPSTDVRYAWFFPHTKRWVGSRSRGCGQSDHRRAPCFRILCGKERGCPSRGAACAQR